MCIAIRASAETGIERHLGIPFNNVFHSDTSKTEANICSDQSYRGKPDILLNNNNKL